jgi:hypothetical protein
MLDGTGERAGSAHGETNPVTHVQVATTAEYEAALVTPQ